MSIVDAIQRAKQMGLNPPGLAPTHSTPTTQANKAETTQARQPAPRSRAARVSGTADSPRYPILSCEPATCAHWHVIAPNGEDVSTQRASTPYRMLRARVLQGCRKQGWSTLAITSPGPGEGKSVTALNLATAIAREGNHNVYLLDLDLRKPSICRYLGVTPVNELTSYFSGGLAAQEVFFTLAGIDRLNIAGCVQGTIHASELLSSGKLEELLEYIGSVAGNPLILIDLPPIVSTDDALVVAPRVDATLLVVSEGVTKRESMERALSLLTDFQVAGIAVNRASESVGTEYYGYYESR